MSSFLRNLADRSRRAGRPFNTAALEDEIAHRRSERNNHNDDRPANMEDGASFNATFGGSQHPIDLTTTTRSVYPEEHDGRNSLDGLLDRRDRGGWAQVDGEMDAISLGSRTPANPGNAGNSTIPRNNDGPQMSDAERAAYYCLNRARARERGLSCAKVILNVFDAIGECMSGCGPAFNAVCRWFCWSSSSACQGAGDTWTDEFATRFCVAIFWIAVFVAVIVGIVYVAITLNARAHSSSPGGVAASITSATIAAATIAAANVTSTVL